MARAHNPGPKPIPFDRVVFEELCNIQCTQTEIAAVMKMSVDSLVRKVEAHYCQRYADVYKVHIEYGKMSLRRMQLNLAKRSAAMAIWLGKQYLGQKEHLALTHASPEVIQHFEGIMKQLAKKQDELIEVEAVQESDLSH
jgi:hypothetical protein